MAVVSTPRLYGMGDTVGHAISSSHDGRLKVQRALP
jgi:hypothetical protein